jgi:hypothetical protein
LTTPPQKANFRSLKSHQFEFAFEDSQSAGATRLQILLLIHALATFLMWLVGKLAENRKLRPAYESNNRKDRPTISLLTLGAMIYAERTLALTETLVHGLFRTPMNTAELRLLPLQIIRTEPLNHIQHSTHLQI